MAYGQINEDSLFTDHIGGLLKGPSAPNFKNAVTEMLNRLHDPFTTIEETAKDISDSIVLPNRPLLQWHEDSIASLYFDNNFIQANSNENGTDTSFLHLIDTLKNARGVIVDLRQASANGISWNYMLCVEKLFSYLTDKDLTYPTFRTRIHYGHESQGWDMSSFYYQGWLLQNTFVNKRRPNAIHKPVCLLVNRFDANISFPIAAMQQEGDALVVADDSLGNKFDHSSTYPMQLADNLKVSIGTGEAIYRTGKTFSPDITAHRTGSGHDDLAMSVALKSLQSKTPVTHAPVEPLSNVFATAKVEGYDSLTYPPAPLRLLGLMRYWSAIQYFCPNKDRIVKNWDSVLYEYVPKFLQAKDSLDYNQAVAQLITEIHDGHGWFDSKVWNRRYHGVPELQVIYIENKSIVYKIYNDTLKNILSPGDEIIKVDGVGVDKLRNRLAQYIGASNNAALQRSISQYLLSGPG